jgi:hypothetical protein
MPNQHSSQANKNGSSLFSRTSILFSTRKDKNKANITSPILESADHDSPPTSGSPPPPTTEAVALGRSLSKSSHHRYSQSVTTIDLRRSVSLRSIASPQQRPNHHRLTSTATLALEHPPSSSHSSKTLLHIPTFSKRQKSTENVRDLAESTEEVTKYPGMTAVQYRNTQPGRPPGTSHSMSNLSYTQTNGSLGSSIPSVPSAAPGAQNPQTVYQHITDTCSKRISTLDYLRKACVLSWLIIEPQC